MYLCALLKSRYTEVGQMEFTLKMLKVIAMFLSPKVDTILNSQ